MVAGKPVPNILDGAFGLGAAEYEELMRSLEESLFEDMRRDEAAFLAEHERWESAAADSDLSMLVRRRPPLAFSRLRLTNRPSSCLREFCCVPANAAIPEA